jgi:hypothetical protein
MSRKQKPAPAEVSYKTHRLVNRKTDKLASGTTWLLDLAACSVALGHTKGLPSLLPQQKAAKLLQHNELRPFKAQKKQKQVKKAATSPSELRTLANQAIPAIAVYYTVKVIPWKKPTEVNRKGFVAWIVREMRVPGSDLNRYLSGSTDFQGLVETVRGERWWLDQLKMQSK